MSLWKAPNAPIARYYGPSGGSTTYYYWLQAVYPGGARSALSAAGSVANAQASLSGSQFNQVTWDSVPGAVGYNVFRTTSSTAPGLAATSYVFTSETGFKDDGGITFPTTTQTVLIDGVYLARAIYDFATDGGAAGAITPSVSDTIPANAIMIGAQINSVVAVTSGGSATVAVGTVAGSAANSILTATGKASFTLDALVNGTVTFAAGVKMTAAGQINITVGTAALTAGRLEIFVLYVLPTYA